MRFLKLGVISIVFFALLITGISLLLPSTIFISRAININAPADTIYANVVDLAKWKYWYADFDSSNAQLSPTTSGKGATLLMNKTTVKIVKADTTKITAVWLSGNNNALPGEFNFLSQGSATQMTLQWRFTHTVKWYPWQKFASILSDKAIGPTMEKSLDNLKKMLEESE